MSSVMKRVYTATSHAYCEAIDTPPRHHANPPHSGGNWTIHESKSDEGVRLIWTCEASERVPPRTPSKFHPHAGTKKPTKKPKPVAPKPVVAAAPPPKKPARPKPAKGQAPAPVEGA